MKNKTQLISLTATLIFILTAYSLAETPKTKGRITNVTVYKGQALVTRTIDIDLPAGTSELIVEDLPPKIIPESLFAQTVGSTKVLSVRYREQAVEADTRQEVKELDQQIKQLNITIYETDRKKQHLDNQWSMFVKLRDFSALAPNSDLNRGLMIFEPIRDLANFIQQKGQEYIDQALALEAHLNDLKENLELLKRKRAELDTGKSRTERQAVLYLSNDKKTKTTIRLNYLVNDAKWLTQYNLRANPDKSNVLIEYNAVVNQTSGEDWNSIELKLSTAQPAMVAAPPTLQPMLVTLSSSFSEMNQQPTQQMKYDRSKTFENLIRNRRNEAKKGAGANYALGKIALDNQVLELNASKSELAQMQQQMEQITRIEGVSVTYDLAGQLTLPSRTDQQLVSIAAVTTKANFTLVATPLLTDYVYLQADILNNSNTIFLPGPSSMFRNGQFVGKSDQPLVTIGSKFTAGFGIDSQIQVTRQLEDKQTKIQGGNRIDTYNYRIAVSNYKNSPAQLRLLDRLPYTDSDSIKIELQNTSPQLSDNAEYLRTDRKKGILQWDLDLAPNSADSKATIVTYSFTMEYDKNMQIQPRKN